MKAINNDNKGNSNMNDNELFRRINVYRDDGLIFKAFIISINDHCTNKRLEAAAKKCIGDHTEAVSMGLIYETLKTWFPHENST